MNFILHLSYIFNRILESINTFLHHFLFHFFNLHILLQSSLFNHSVIPSSSSLTFIFFLLLCIISASFPFHPASEPFSDSASSSPLQQKTRFCNLSFAANRTFLQAATELALKIYSLQFKPSTLRAHMKPKRNQQKKNAEEELKEKEEHTKDSHLFPSPRWNR